MAKKNEEDKDVLGYKGKRFDIRALMVKYGVTISDLANGTGLSYGSVQSIIRLNRPSMTNLYKIAKALGCDITDLFLSEAEIEHPTLIEKVENQTSLDDSSDDNMCTELTQSCSSEEVHDAITCPYCSKRFLLLDL